MEEFCIILQEKFKVKFLIECNKVHKLNHCTIQWYFEEKHEYSMNLNII